MTRHGHRLSRDDWKGRALAVVIGAALAWWIVAWIDWSLMQ